MNLPQEVSDAIIDCLEDDHDALKACALTRRTWVHRSRHHLHQHVTIDCSAPKVPSASYYSTGAAQYIRKLKLVAPPSPTLYGGQNAKTRSLWTVIPRFTEIKSLTLMFSNWVGLGKPYGALADITRNVTHLDLVYASFNQLDDLFDFLAMFPVLESLSLASLSFGFSYASSSVNFASPPPNLRSLRYTTHSTAPGFAHCLAQWLSHLPVASSPKFSLTWASAANEGFVRVLRGLDSRLAHLDIPAWTASTMTLPDNVCNALQSVSINGCLSFTRDGVQEALAFLDMVPTLELRRITYDCSSSACFDTVDEYALSLLDEALFTPKFDNLETVAFKLHKDASRDGKVADTLKRSLQRCQARGALSVTTATD